MKTAAMGDDGDLDPQGLPIPFPYALALQPEGEVEAAAEGGGGGPPGALNMMEIDEIADWLLDLVDPLFDEPYGDEEEDATSSASTITAETCIAGDEMMLPTGVADWDAWLLRDQYLAADPDGDDDASTTTTSTAAEMWVDGRRWEMYKGEDGEWLLRCDDWFPRPLFHAAATAATAESWVFGDDHRQLGAGECGAAGDLPLDWWVPEEPTGPPEELAEGGGVLPDLEAALSLYMSREGTYTSTS